MKDILFILIILFILVIGSLREDSWHLTMDRQISNAKRREDSIKGLYMQKAALYDTEQRKDSVLKDHIKQLIEMKYNSQNSNQ